MNVLNALLEKTRKQRSARKRRAHVRDNMRREAAGLAPVLTQHEKHERLAAAWTGHDCLMDIERLLRARGCQLWIVWKGRFAQVYTQHVETGAIEILQQADRKRRALEVGGMHNTEMGQRISAILAQHECEMEGFWRGKEYILQLGSRAVSTTDCLRLVTCGDNRKSRLMFSDEADA